MSDATDLQVPTPDLGGRRGRASDWITQRWVQATGRRVTWAEHPWLEAPVGDVDRIGPGFFDRHAEREGLVKVQGTGPIGLLPRFAELAGPGCSPDVVALPIARFYERASEYELDVWSEWCGAFRPLGNVLAALFSRRLQQLNVPLSALDTRLGITSRVLEYRGRDASRRLTAWVRETVATRRTLYAGAYSTCRVPGWSGTCVRVAFPLPNGHALVVMRPESHDDGSFTLWSEGRGFGDPGFYFYVEDVPGRGWARHVRAFKESIHVFAGEDVAVRADHELRFFGLRVLRLHYRMRTDDPAQDDASPGAA